MAEYDINNEEQYIKAAEKIKDYYEKNKSEIEYLYREDNKNSSFDDLEDINKIKGIYDDFKSSYSLEELKNYKDEDIINKFIFTKGNKDNLCYKLEYAIKVGGIGQASVFNKYGLCKNETGWHLGSSSKKSESINKERAIKEGKKQLDLIILGGKIIEKYIGVNKLDSIMDYDKLDKELSKETSNFSTKTWVRKYYHLLFPEYFCNWFGDNKISDVLSKLEINNQSETYYGKSGQLMKIYKHTGLNNPVLIMFICVSLLGIKEEENDDNDRIRYWLYSPGNDAEDWEEQYNNGIIAIGKDAIGDLKVFKSKEEMRKKMQEIIAPQKNPTQSANTSWQFVHVMKPGDIVFAKKGRQTIIGRGIVSGDYKFDSNRIHHKNIRNIQWTHKKTCNFSEELFSMKTLTNITNDSELIKKIENSFNNNEDNEVKNNNTKIITNYLNTILYGPPGTGKTYNTVIEAMRIINPNLIDEYEKNQKNYDEIKEEFDKAKKEGRIEFITFHQSYSYEEFIEGIKPVVSNDFECENDEINNNGEIKYKIDEGVFKRICNKAITAKLKKDNSIKDLIRSDASVWKVTIRDVVKQDCFGNNRVRIDYDFETKEAIKFNEQIDKGDIILTTNGSRSKINGIAIVNNDEAIKLDSSEDQTSRDVIWLVKDIDENIKELNDNKLLSRNTFSRVPSMKASNILKLTLDLNGKKENKSNDKSEPYVLIIDEINRGNISKIFGELITLIEEDKRESFSVRLPYSHEEFTVPKNLYIIGTMNTSDRSIASIDIALRRRFTFKEMMPDSKLVADFGVEFSKKFEELNNRIRILLDRDHQIGHSYFIKTKYNNENNNNNIKTLKEIWFDCVMPLLNEYFYNDWEKLKLIIPGFIKSIDIPQNLKEECESAYEFKTIGDMKDDKAFVEALNQAEYKEKE